MPRELECFKLRPVYNVEGYVHTRFPQKQNVFRSVKHFFLQKANRKLMNSQQGCEGKCQLLVVHVQERGGPMSKPIHRPK